MYGNGPGHKITDNKRPDVRNVDTSKKLTFEECLFSSSLSLRTVMQYIYLSIVLKYTFWVSVLYLSITFSGNLWL